MYPTIAQKLGELTMNNASVYTMPWAEMKSTLSRISEPLSVSGMLKDVFKPLNISEKLSEAYQIPPTEDISNPLTDDESSSRVEIKSTEEPMDDVDQ